MVLKPVFRSCAVWLSWALIAVVALGLTGTVFALGNSMAVIRFPAGLLLLILTPAHLWLGPRRYALFVGVAAAVALLPLANGYFKPNDPCEGTCLTLYQKNLMSKSWPREPLAQEMIGADAEIVTLQEVSDHNLKFMAALFDHYPFSVICPFRPNQDVAVLTSLPVVEDTAFCLEGAGMAGVMVLHPNHGSIWVISIHLEWPFPFEQFEQMKRVEEKLEALDQPILIGGDFNMVTWGGSVSRLARAAGNTPFGPYRNTHMFGQKFLPLSIDNVLVPEGSTGQLERRPRLASDHMGLLARIALP